MRMTSWAFDLGIVLRGNNPGCDCKRCTSGFEKNLRGLTQSTSDATPRLRAKRGVSAPESLCLLRAQHTSHGWWGLQAVNATPPFLFPTPQFLNPGLLPHSPLPSMPSTHITSPGEKEKKKAFGLKGRTQGVGHSRLGVLQD